MKASLISLFLVYAFIARAESPTGGSTGADGALELTTPGVVVFDPHFYSPPLNPSGDNVFQFTTIHIGRDVTVRLSSRNLNGPVSWLAQGPVQIDGTIDLSGEEGGAWPAVAGSGGFPGGPPLSPGYGPRGVTRNSFLVPLFGGSGGKGGATIGGGGGGGALLIASNSSITVSGKIIANGGTSSGGWGGNGGAIRLVAPLIDGRDGTLSARGGQPGGADGAVRFEAYHNQFQGTVSTSHVFKGKPLGLFLPPTGPPSVRVESIDGMLAPVQEFTVNQPSSVKVGLEARNIPTGTIIDLHCWAQDGQSQSVESSPLIGTEEHSRATALVLFPRGTSRCFAEAAWTRTPTR